jgi:glycosyltransferase involved in cell wall biosynthesis
MPRAIGWRDFTAFARIVKYLRAGGPFDVIHGHSSKGGAYARLVRPLGHRPIVYTPHAFVTMSPRRGLGPLLYRAVEACLGRLSDRVICASSVEREHARSLALPDRKLALISHGSAGDDSLPREAARRKLGLRNDEIAVGFVGRLDEQKAPERIIAAARQLCSELPKLTFVMIGDGPKRRLLEAETQKAGLSDRVRWMGALNSRRLMLAFDIFAVPSLYEGFPYVFLEALRAGLPIVTTDVGGAREAVEPGVNGFIVPDGEGGRMAEPLRRLATDQRLRRAMGKASRDRSRMFSIASMVDATEDLYRALVPASAPTPASRAAIPGSETETLGSRFETA